MRVSVIVVSYHTGPALIACLDSVLAQDRLAEAILVDNGNDPETRDALAAKAERAPALRVLTGHGNVGFAAGCNLGASRAVGEVLLFLNPDAALPDGTLSRCLAVLRDHPEAWALGIRLLNADGSDQRGSRRNLPDPWSSLVEVLRLDRLGLGRRVNLHETPAGDAVTPVECISGAFVMMPRDAFDRAGGFDAGYFLHVEDIDLCMEIRRRGGTILFAPAIHATHLQGTSRVFSLQPEWHKARGFVRYFRKHFSATHPGWLLWLLAVGVYARFALRAVPILLRRRS